MSTLATYRRSGGWAYTHLIQQLEQGHHPVVRGWRHHKPNSSSGSPDYLAMTESTLWQGLWYCQINASWSQMRRPSRTTLIASAYDPIICGHFGVEKTLEKLGRYWWWYGMGTDVHEYVKPASVSADEE